MSQDNFSGIVSSWELSACSQVTSLPLYAAIRPRIAVSVLSATFFSSLIGLPERMLSIRSVCSCTYGLGAALSCSRVTTFLPLIVWALTWQCALRQSFVSAIFDAHVGLCGHRLRL